MGPKLALFQGYIWAIFAYPMSSKYDSLHISQEFKTVFTHKTNFSSTFAQEYPSLTMLRVPRETWRSYEPQSTHHAKAVRGKKTHQTIEPNVAYTFRPLASLLTVK